MAMNNNSNNRIEQIKSTVALNKFLSKAFKSGFDVKRGFFNAQYKHDLQFIDGESEETKWLSNNLVLHNLLLLQKHEESHINNNSLNYMVNAINKIVIAKNITDEDYFRISAYLWNAPSDLLRRVIFDKGQEKKQGLAKEGEALVGIRKLFPALYIKNDAELLFFRQPISQKTWTIIVGDKEINKDTEFEMAIERDYWYLFYALRAYCIPNDNEMSKYGKELRKELFNVDAYDQIKNISFLALLIFAQYDYYYRLMLEQSLKTAINKKSVVLREDDYLIEHQGEQKVENYKAYCREYKMGRDIKSFAIRSKGGFKFHRDVISEINEATLIAEGIYQIIENAVKYTGGGLVSIRIYDIKNERNKHYLVNEYGNKFFKDKFENFYLEIEISDLSDKSFSNTFIENLEKRAKTSFEREVARKIVEKNKVEPIKLKDFFELDKKIDIWESYYGNLNNRVHHYGLQIFNSIVRSRNGLFIVAGNGDYYSNTILDEEDDQFYKESNEEGDKFYDKFDKNISGTSYRVLLPLSHKRMVNGNIVTEMPQMDEIALAEQTSFYDLLENFPSIICESKEDIIDEISKNLNISETGVADYVADYSEIVDKKITVEIFLKAILQRVFNRYYANECDSSPTHIAVVNLETYQLLEAVRVLALFYYKPSGCKGMKNVQIYLHGKNPGEEIVFFGERLDDILQNFNKTALARGVVSESSLIINSILNGRNK